MPLDRGSFPRFHVSIPGFEIPDLFLEMFNTAIETNATIINGEESGRLFNREVDAANECIAHAMLRQPGFHSLNATRLFGA
jgi:hypothetical protein